MAEEKHSAQGGGDDDFPYKRLYGDMASEIAVRFHNLLSYKPTFRVLRYGINNAPEFETQHLRFCFGGSKDPLIMVNQVVVKQQLLRDWQ
jgi:hypothetical protein